MSDRIDPRTGRAIGDHGTALDAIDYVLDELRDFASDFLRAWRMGVLDEWPEFYAWLAEREAVIAPPLQSTAVGPASVTGACKRGGEAEATQSKAPLP